MTKQQEKKEDDAPIYPDVLVGQLFPNPPMEDGRVYLACVGYLEHSVKIEVSTQEGESLHLSEHQLPVSGGTIKLDFSEWLPGEYKFTVRCGEHVENRSLTIEAPKKKWTWRRLFWSGS